MLQAPYTCLKEVAHRSLPRGMEPVKHNGGRHDRRPPSEIEYPHRPARQLFRIASASAR